MTEQEADSANDEADEVQPMKTTPNFIKKAKIIEEHSEEGGVSMSVKADKTTQSNVESVHCGIIGHHEEECQK